MPVTADTPAPYAPATAIVGLIDRHRNKGLPSPVDAEVLARAGISESLIPRTLQAMQTLDLLDDDKNPTEQLEKLRKAPEAEYKPRMIEWLNSAYADALAFIDPANADEIEIRDAFRSYKPVGQQDRMVTLFIGLYTAAGVITEKLTRQPTPRKLATGKTSASVKSVRASRQAEAPSPPAAAATTPNGLPPVLAGLLSSLPADGESWTKDRRDGFVHTFGVVLDFCFPVISGDAQNNNKAGTGGGEQ